jgi:hypothetical protein
MGKRIAIHRRGFMKAAGSHIGATGLLLAIGPPAKASRRVLVSARRKDSRGSRRTRGRCVSFSKVARERLRIPAPRR